MINQNIFQKSVKIKLREDLVLDFFFNIRSLCILMEEFGYKNIEQIIRDLTDITTFTAVMTAIKILYASTELDDDITFVEFCRIFNNEDMLTNVYNEVCKNITKFLNVEKKKTIQPMVEERMMKIQGEINMTGSNILTLIRITHFVRQD